MLSTLVQVIEPFHSETTMLVPEDNHRLSQHILSKKVLVADDTVAYRELVVKKLREKGFTEIFCANNGQEAFNLCQRERIDIVFMDHMMPLMSGLDAAEKIKYWAPDTLILGFSAVLSAQRKAKIGVQAMDKDFVKNFKNFDQVFDFIEDWYHRD